MQHWIKREFRRALFLSAILLFTCSTSYAEETSFWLKLKHAWYDIFAPDYYYQPIVNDGLDISKAGETKSFELVHKYDRAYIVGLILEDYRKSYDKNRVERFETTLQLEISFYADDALLLKKSVTDGYSPFLATYGGGLDMFFYKVPNDLPLNKKITCIVRIIKPDKHLQDTYGPVRFYVAKMSDK